MNNPQVTIIVVNWNGKSYLENCLTSLAAQSYCAGEIILVDNGSTDSSVQAIRANFPTVRVVALPTNMGFAGGNSEGIKIAKGPFIALVNNDARVHRTWLENLLQPMLADPTVGICASKLIFDDGRIINSAGDGLTRAAVGFNRGLGVDAASFNVTEHVFGACGAAALYRRRMLDDIGFLDNDFFLYDEDTDLSFRALLSGWKCAYVPDAVAYHKGNATAGRLSDTHVYYHSRNLEFVWIKNMPTALMIRYAHQKLLQEIGSFAYLCLRHGKWRAFFRAKRDALRMLPKMLTKRSEIQRRRRVTTGYISNHLTSMFNAAILRQKIQQFIRG